MNASLEYREIRSDGTRTYILNGSKLSIRGRTPFKSDFSLVVDLADASPDIAVLNVRPRTFFIFVALFAIFVMAAITSEVGGWSNADNHVSQIFWGFSLIMAFFSAACWRKVPFSQFRTKSGIVLFDVAKRGPDVAKYDAFIAAIKQGIPTANKPDRV